jgi:thioredoxin reductase (NADPH)
MDGVSAPQSREDSPFVKAHRDELFPVLTEAQVSRIVPFATERRFADGESLWEAGDRGISFFVVLEGELAILSGGDELVTVHGVHAFSGDVDLLSGRPVVVRGRARGAARVLEVGNERFRALVKTDAQLGETLLRAFLMRRIALMAAGLGQVVLIGSRFSAGTLALQEFLTRNDIPYAYLDVDRDADVQTTLEGFGVTVDDVPVVICRGSRVLKKPTIEDVGDCLGLNAVNEGVVRDVVIVGAGPAGLASAVYAASEGLDALVLEASAPGGQAGSSTRIENYLGFPSGISGQLLASRALVQAQKFGAELAVARTAASLTCDRRPYRLDLGDTSVSARTVIIATGVQYRKPDIPNLERFVGVGVYFGATPLEGVLCTGEDVVVVGGGNSAGQAAVYLSAVGRNVTMLVRGAALADTMSRYLIRRIEETPNIRLLTRARIVSLEGDGHLERVTWEGADGTSTSADVRHVFLMTGADPNTAWLKKCVALDAKGFVKTGIDLDAGELKAAGWPLARPPMLFETSLPGVFAVGDVRASSVKRVAAAVGEGSVCIQLVHKVLAE